MYRTIRIEQTADGRWVVVSEGLDGSRDVQQTCPTMEAAEAAAGA